MLKTQLFKTGHNYEYSAFSEPDLEQITCCLFLKFFSLGDLVGLFSNYYKYFTSNIWQFPNQLNTFCCKINHIFQQEQKKNH